MIKNEIYIKLNKKKKVLSVARRILFYELFHATNHAEVSDYLVIILLSYEKYSFAYIICENGLIELTSNLETQVKNFWKDFI